jgi:hypothetical protein
MACYIVNYDLRKVKDYDSLITAIKGYGTWAKVLKSCWAIVTQNSAEQIRDYLLSYMDSDDGIFVVKSGVEAAWSNVECSSDWLKKNL